MNWKGGLVAIFTPTKDGNGIYGTAFPVAPGKLMTARHVVCPEAKAGDLGSERDPDKPILIRWWYSKERPGYQSVSDDNLIVWGDDKDHDLVVLNVDFPLDRPEICLVQPAKRYGSKKWESEGFPRAAKVQDQRKPKSFAGECKSKADPEQFFECSVTTSPADEEDWGGASGMPIVVDGYVIGVAVEVPRGFGGKDIHVTPIWKAWDEGLREHLKHQDELASIRAEVRNAVANINDISGDIKKVFSDQFKLNNINDEKQWCDSAVEAVLHNHEPGEVFARLSSAMTIIDEGNGHCAHLYKLARTIAPALLRHHNTAVDWLRDRLGTGAAVLGDIPVGFYSMAELIVAGAEGREARFLRRRSEHDTPPGEECTPFEPQCVNNKLEVAVIEAFRDRYPELKTEELQGRFTTVAFNNLSRKLNVNAGEGNTEELRDYLKILRSMQRPTPYLAFELPEDNQEGYAEFIIEIEQLSRDVPELVIIAVDPSKRVSQTGIVRSFCFLIPLEAAGITA